MSRIYAFDPGRDAAVVAGLLSRASDQPVSAEAIRRRFASTVSEPIKRSLLSLVDDKPVACGIAIRQGPAAEEDYELILIVDQAWRGHGIGSAMHDRLRSWLNKKGARVTRCDIIDDEPAARRFVEAYGFGKDGN